MIFSSGFSSSIALSQATPGSSLNIVQKITGQVLPLESMLFTPLNLVTTLALFVTLPLLFCAIQPRDGDVQIASLPGPAAPETANSPEEKAPRTLARKVEEAWILNVIFVVAGIAALGLVWRQNGFSLDLNSVIFLFILAGLLLHWRPIAYVKAINNAARITGPLILQYPIYGGIMGIMTSTGLADVFAKGFIQFANAHTLPFWNFIASLIISLFVPSAGGHWAVQGPFTVPAAVVYMPLKQPLRWESPTESRSRT